MFGMLVRFVLIIVLSAGSSITAAQSKDRAHAFVDGYYSRQGNEGSPAETSGHSIYIKFYPDERVAQLYVPYPYSKTLKPSQLHAIFQHIGDQIIPGSYVKDDFDLLEKSAVVDMESYQTKGSRVAFECGGNALCLGEFGDNSMTLSKPGIVGDHIIKFDKVSSPP